MNTAERHAWHTFREIMARRQHEFDGQVPVALVVASVCHGGAACHGADDDESVCIDKTGHFVVLRPPGMTREEVAAMLDGLAARIRNGSMG